MQNLNMYYLRCIPADWNTMIALGEKLGIIKLQYKTDLEGNILATEEPAVVATEGGAWDYIGEIKRPTGELDAEGNPIMETITNEQGIPYIHANLISPINMYETAKDMAGTEEEIATALANLGKFFLLDAQGDARAPSQPHRVFAGI